MTTEIIALRPKSRTEIARTKVKYALVVIMVCKTLKRDLKPKIWKKNERNRFIIARIGLFEGKYYFSVRSRVALH